MPATSCSTGTCPLSSRRGWVFWILLLGFVAFLQWPMLKGMYYKSRGGGVSSKVAWITDLDAAQARAAESGKPILVDFTASWCPPCNVMKHEVWTNERVAAAANGSYVPLLIDIDAGKNAETAQRYGVHSIPTILILDEKGSVLHTGSFMDADEMLTFLTRVS